MANEIFISYKRADLEKVKAIKTELDEVLRGEHCWIESGNRAFQDKIDKAIEVSSVFLFMMSKSYVESPNCLKELLKADKEYAKDENKHLVLVKIEHNNDSHEDINHRWNWYHQQRHHPTISRERS